jgi:hypothetical protein
MRAMLAAGKSMNLVMDVKEDDLRKLDIPVCGVAGEKDPERKFVERMQGVVPDFSFTIVPGKDHDGMFTDKIYHDTTVAFVKRVGNTGAG